MNQALSKEKANIQLSTSFRRSYCYKRHLKASLLFLILNLIAIPCFAATYYVATDGNDSTGDGSSGNEWLTIGYALGNMSSSDTLIIRDGTYSGANNMITSSQHPPAGISPSSPTIVRAENDGAVFIDGEAKRDPFTFTGTYGGTEDMYAWYFQGINFVRGEISACQLYDGGGGDKTAGDLPAGHMDAYVTFKNCGFHVSNSASNSNTWTVLAGYARYVLYEDCWCWGNARYGFEAFFSDYVTYRRCVDRRDEVRGSIPNYPSASFMNYDSHYVLYQNCISIDVNNSLWQKTSTGASQKDPTGAFLVRYSYNATYPRTSEDTYFQGCMVVNHNTSTDSSQHTYLSGWYSTGNGDGEPINTRLSNCVVVGSTTGISVSHFTVRDFYIDHCMTLHADHKGSTWIGDFGIGEYNDTSGTVITNSASVNNDFMAAFRNMDPSSDYNGAYGNNSNKMPYGSHNVTLDPGILYPVRIEDGSAYDGVASDGGDIGATILKKYGKDGTFYGETGYATLTSNNLWPWPNEDKIKTAFSLDYGSTTETRGFCSTSKQLDGINEITLTSYIWEYLGNQMPENIYKNINWEANLRVLCHSCPVCGHEYGELLETCPLCGATCSDN